MVRGVGARMGSGEAVAPELQSRAVAPLQWRLMCDMGLAARMLSSELEMYPMIAVAHEIAMVRTAGSICMGVRHPAASFPRREPAAAPAERAANFFERVKTNGNQGMSAAETKSASMPPAELEICSR